MSKTAFDYPVYFPFGATTEPYSKANPHKGDDRCNAMNVPIVVNGVQIGLTGATGYTFDNDGNQGTPGAAHLHTQKIVNGTAINPNGGGNTLKNPVTVTVVGENAGKGKYVQLKDGDGALWEYLHMSRQDVKQGQTLQGEIMEEGDVYNLYKELTKEDPPMDFVKRVLAQKGKDRLYAFFTDPVIQAYMKDLRQWKASGQQLTDSQKKLNAIIEIVK